MPDHEVPSDVMDRVAAFLTPGRSGQIILNVNDGEIASCQFTEYVKVARKNGDAAPPTPQRRRR